MPTLTNLSTRLSNQPNHPVELPLANILVFNVEHKMKQRLMQCWQSFKSLPLWVQIWIGGILIPGNALAFFMLDTWAGQLTASAAIFVVLTNIPIMLIARGMSKLMAVPHLIVWYPLVAVLGYRLFSVSSSTEIGALETSFILLIITINGISLLFDTKDSIDWFRGVRDIPGQEPTGAKQAGNEAE